jgi:hypothetical protein
MNMFKFFLFIFLVPKIVLASCFLGFSTAFGVISRAYRGMCRRTRIERVSCLVCLRVTKAKVIFSC